MVNRAEQHDGVNHNTLRDTSHRHAFSTGFAAKGGVWAGMGGAYMYMAANIRNTVDGLENG